MRNRVGLQFIFTKWNPSPAIGEEKNILSFIIYYRSTRNYSTLIVSAPLHVWALYIFVPDFVFVNLIMMMSHTACLLYDNLANYFSKNIIRLIGYTPYFVFLLQSREIVYVTKYNYYRRDYFL